MASLQRIINDIPVGQSNAISAANFEAAIGNAPSGTNNDTTRREISDSILSNNIPIGSSPGSGYWLIDSDDEYRSVIEHIEGMIDSYEAKRDAITVGWNRRKASKSTATPWPK